MDHRYFNSISHFLNESWAANVLNMKVNPRHGPDLISDDKVIESKFKAVYLSEYTHICWKVLEYQMNYDQDKQGRPAYWGLGTYILKKHVSDIEPRGLRELEMLILGRTLTIVPWDWMEQFPAYHQRGETKKSKWDNTIRFPKGRLLPKIIAAYQVRGGEVRIAEGVNPEKFNINGKLISLNP